MAQKLLLALLLVLNLLLLCFPSVSCQATARPSFLPRRRLFVFGDSYADTGNSPVASSSSWKVPYGMTFPGKPSGRFSDGRVLPDFVAKYYGLQSPTPYKFRKSGAEQARRYGMNFAIGGTGVFKTMVALPNMTAQIDMFQQVIGEGMYTVDDLHASLALVQLSGNDYAAFLSRNGSFEALPAFIQRVVDQMTINIKRIHGLGMGKVAVTCLPPLGCLPAFTGFTSPRKCVDFINPFVETHNRLLAGAVADLNNETGTSAFAVANLYDSFTSALGNSTFDRPLEPCCVGVNSTYKCGDVDPSGTKMYKVCPSPGSRFFWDMVHPTQRGWEVVFSSLEPTFKHL